MSGPATVEPAARGQRKSDGSSPQLLERTFAVLALFTPKHPEWTTTEIGRACDLPVPTVHRILAALQQHDFVVRDEITKRFRLGPAALDLGRSAQAATDLRSVSLPVLQRLSVQTGETALLTVPSDDRRHAVCLERVESTQPLRLSVQPGRQLPLHAGASQKAILAFLPDADLEPVLAGPMEKLCKATIVDPDRLRDELRSIREKGWATSFEETNLGVWGIAVTLLDERNHPVAAIGIAGPQARLQRRLIDTGLRALRTSTEEIATKVALRSSCPQEPRRRGRSVPAGTKRGSG